MIRPVWGDANVRIREVDGLGVAMLSPEDVMLSPGVRKIGLLAWAGPGPSQVAICLVFDAEPNARYSVSVASYTRDWVVQLSSHTANGPKSVTPRLIRHREFDTAILPCSGVAQ